MGVLEVFRRFVLRDHVRDHAEIDDQLEATDEQLSDLEVRTRRLEVEKRIRVRRARGEATGR